MKVSANLLILFLLTYQAISAQEINKIINDPDLDNREVMVGVCNREGLGQGEFGTHFSTEYEKYTPDGKYIDKIKPYIDKVDITLVFGTWCKDSRLQVPRFFKVLDEAGFDENQLKVIGVNRKKNAVTSNIEDLGIALVPTCIVYQDGKELGRIIETPKKTLEKDLARIVKKAR